MGGTAVETVPGGVIDRLLMGGGKPELAAVRAQGAVSAYARAFAEAGRLDAADVSVASWRRYTWHGSWLTLPDGTARPMTDIGERLRELPRRPVAPRSAEDLVVGELLSELRDVRFALRPLPSGLASAGDVVPEYRAGIAAIAAVRSSLADRLDLVGHLDLLAADLTVRAGQPGAGEWWEAARARLAEAGDTRGQAAAMLVAGDWYAAPLSSPLVWNCLVAVTPVNMGWEFAHDVEAQEFAGAAVQPVRAEAMYAAASALYEEAGDQVGLAATALRRAFLAVVDGRPQNAITLCAWAREVFETADRPLDTAIAATHGALAAIADDRFPEDVTVADLVVRLGRDRIGHAPVLGLGVMCARVARAWVRDHQAERATAALALAERIFRGLGESHLRAQALAEAASVAAAVGDVVATRIAALEALAADPGPLAEPADPLDARRVWRAVLAGWLRNVFGAQRDLDGMTMATDLLTEVLEPLRPLLPRFDVRRRLVAEHLLEVLDDTAGGVEVVLYRARRAQDDGQDSLAAELISQARAIVPTTPPHLHDYYDAVISLYADECDRASEAFERHVAAALSRVDDSPTGRRQRRMLRAEAMAFQVNARGHGRARAHFTALADAATPWWSGLGPGWQHLDLLARLHELEGDLPAAAALAGEALAEIESTRAGLRHDDRKRAYLGTDEVQNTYVDATRISLALVEKARADGDAGGVSRWSAVAFATAERARARALLDLVVADREVERAGLSRDLVARWRFATAEVALAQQRLAAAEQRETPVDDQRARLFAAIAALRAVEVELSEANPRFAAFINPQAEVGELAEVAARLPDGAVLVQYVVGRADLLAWAITRDGMVAECAVPGRHGLARLVDLVVDECARGGDGYTEPAEELSALLLEPLRPAIDGCASLLFVPAGPMLRLPFGVLPWNGAPLVDSAPVVVVPSASVLRGERRERNNSSAPLVVGDPREMAHGSRPALPLPGSREEAIAVARRLPGSILLLGETATEDNVRGALPNAPLVHLATHGVLDAEAPLASAILLAFGQNLTVADLMGAELEADLVVLSACHTGTGEIVRNDELLGFGRALLAAGARSVIVTLWAVSDRSAALLMTEFYRLRSEGLPDREALQRASRHVRTLSRDEILAAAAEPDGPDAVAVGEEAGGARNVSPWPVDRVPHAHPRHWAPFVLISAE
ncbi:CHAT domain-containing protein [Lentzea sp. NPDC058450]|uniref:CHAT domain-containing protein n=1 Tax=Lentzea sp. NPDC058450 TaxID=3346505 RepID=UPI00365BFCA6